ncbi:MAG: PQQ-binding-like beta-propeller repeat protein [Pirellulaceae bacterium]
MSHRLLALHALLAIHVGFVTAEKAAAQTEDWPSWQGVERTNVSSQEGLLKEWPEQGPKLLWIYREAGNGYSGPAIVDETFYTLGTEGEQEVLIALDVATGRPCWTTPLSPILSNGWGNGPRSTPTVHDDHVYVLTGIGELVCCTKDSGEQVWSVSLTRDLAGKKPNWGYCESVLIDGDRLICTPGGSEGTIAALDRSNGEVIWRSTGFTEGAQYSSVIIAKPHGTKQYIQLLQKSIIGVDPDNGDVLWRSDWSGRTAVIPTPIFFNNHVFVSSGYGAGCKLVKIRPDNTVEDVYVNKNMKNHHGGVLFHEGHLYGYSDQVGWTCLKFETGEIVWNDKDNDVGKGSVTCVNGQLYLVGERRGVIGLIDASPNGFALHGQFTLDPKSEIRSPRGKIWTHPVVLNGRLYLRDQDIIYCYDISDPRVARK